MKNYRAREKSKVSHMLTTKKMNCSKQKENMTKKTTILKI